MAKNREVTFGGSTFEVDETGYLVETLDAKKWAFRVFLDERKSEECWSQYWKRRGFTFLCGKMYDELKRLYPAAIADERIKWEGEEQHSPMACWCSIPSSPICAVGSRHTARDHFYLINAIIREMGVRFTNSGSDCDQFFMRVWFEKNHLDRKFTSEDGKEIDTWCVVADLMACDEGVAQRMQDKFAKDWLYGVTFGVENDPTISYTVEIEERLAKLDAKEMEGAAK